MKIRRSSKAGYRHIQKVAKNIVENMLQKICYLATQIYLSFGLSSCRLCSRVDFVLFSLFVVSWCQKNIIFQTNNLISENKNWWGNRENMKDLFFRGFLGSVNGPKNSVLNWVSNLNVENNFIKYDIVVHRHIFFSSTILQSNYYVP